MRLAVLDLETDPFEPGRKPEPFVSGYYDGEKYTTIWDSDPIRVIDRTVTMLEREPASILYWHNGGKFDVFYFRPYIRGTVKIISNRIVSCVIGKHEFRDSYAIMPFPLRNYKKKEINYDHMEREHREHYRDEILDYLKGDCVYLFELVTTFHAEFGPKLTIGSSSMAQLKKFHSFEKGSARFDTEIRRDFYCGGRNQCFETGLIYAPLKVLDVNSMYPHVMRSHLHPISTGIIESDRIRENTCFVVASGENRGALPVRTKLGLDFTQTSGVFHASIFEWEAALETGTFIPDKILNCYNFSERSTFAEFIDYSFHNRLEAKKAGDDARDMLWKYCANSAYGKFAQNPENFYDYQLTSADDVLTDPCEHCDGSKICEDQCHMCWRLAGGIEPVREYWIEKAGRSIARWECKFCEGTGFKWHYSEGNDDYTIWASRPRHAYFHNVATGASITGAARALLLRGLASASRPIYCDTDSIILENFRGLTISDTELGAWKIEATGDAIAVCGKKLYCVYSYSPHCTHGKRMDVRCSKCIDGRIESERVILPNGQNSWVVKRAHKGARLTGSELLSVSQGSTVEYASPAPNFKRDGEVKWITRKIRRTGDDKIQSQLNLR